MTTEFFTLFTPLFSNTSLNFYLLPSCGFVSVCSIPPVYTSSIRIFLYKSFCSVIVIPLKINNYHISSWYLCRRSAFRCSVRKSLYLLTLNLSQSKCRVVAKFLVAPACCMEPSHCKYKMYTLLQYPPFLNHILNSSVNNNQQ